MYQTGQPASHTTQLNKHSYMFNWRSFYFMFIYYIILLINSEANRHRSVQTDFGLIFAHYHQHNHSFGSRFKEGTTTTSFVFVGITYSLVTIIVSFNCWREDIPLPVQSNRNIIMSLLNVNSFKYHICFTILHWVMVNGNYIIYMRRIQDIKRTTLL